MSEAPQNPDAGAPDGGGYEYPSLEQEVTPEVLAAGAEPAGSGDGGEGGDGDQPAPGELTEDPVAVEPTD